MSEELETLKFIKHAFERLGIPGIPTKYTSLCLDSIETAFKKQQRKLNLISEVLVDVSKGTYADLNDAINEIREIIENE